MNKYGKNLLKNTCIKIGSGATPRGGDASYKTQGISFIRSQNILDFKFSKDGLAFIDEQQAKELANVELKEKDVLINITGDSVARVCQVPNNVLPARVNQHVAILRPDKRILNPEFLKYCLLSKPNKELLLTYASIGATRKALTKGMLEDFKISLPNLSVQSRIASILSSLDDKIELSRRMNRTLEQMAQALFNHYFVDNIDPDNLPEGWNETLFSEEFLIDKGLSYKGSGLSEEKEGKPMHNLNSIYEGGGYKYEGIKFYKGEHKEKHIVKPWDIIVANTEQGHKYLLIGYPSIVPTFMAEGIFSHHIYRVRVKENSYLSNQFLYYLIMHPNVRDQIICHTNGTTVNMLYKEGLQNPKFNKPPKEIIDKFTSFVTPLWKKKELIHLENKSLVKIRDTLLPKLMSGEIDVSELIKEELRAEEHPSIL